MAKTQGDVLEAILRQLGGYATLGQLYKEAVQVDELRLGSKAPFASLRRVMNADERFVRLEAGLWALERQRRHLPFALRDASRVSGSQDVFSHSYFQGLLIEIGNSRGYRTYVAPQDKNQLFLETPLDAYTTIKQLPTFTYPRFLSGARTVDVIWFNARNMPDTLFEVEQGSDVTAALRKFTDLQDFHASFIIVAPDAQKPAFEAARADAAFEALKNRVRFWGFEYVSRQHNSLADSSPDKDGDTVLNV